MMMMSAASSYQAILSSMMVLWLFPCHVYGCLPVILPAPETMFTSVEFANLSQVPS